MVSVQTQRRLSAIFAADVVGYSTLMEADENGTHQQLRRHWAEVFGPRISEFRGTIIRTIGDGIFAEFSSVVDALECAINIQKHLAGRDLETSKDEGLVWRIGINLGDVIVDGAELYGDGVNIAFRLEALAEPGGICISDAVFTQTKNKVDIVCHSLGRRSVKNIADPIHVYRVEVGAKNRRGAMEAPSQGAMPRALDKPSIAVLPFANLMPDQQKQYLVDGLAEDLITELSMFPELFVAARTSSFAYRDMHVDARELARILDVHYVIEGSMQQDHQGMRITVQLIEADTGSHLWAGRYDRTNAELFEVRDEITRSIAATLTTPAGLIAKAEGARRGRKAPESFTFYDHYLKALDLFRRSTLPPWHEGKELSALAKAEFKLAIDMSDPPHWPAYGGLAWQYAIDFDWSYSSDYARSAQLAFENASIAVKNSPDDYRGHWVLGWAYLFAKHDHDKAIAQYEIAHRMNPGDPRLLAELVQPLIYGEKFDEAIARLEEAIRLNPLREQWYDEFLGWAYEENGQPEITIGLLNKLGELEGWWSHAVLALAYAQTEQLEEFKAQIAIIDTQICEQFEEHFSARFWREWVRQKNPYKNNARAERIIETMASALERIGVEG